MHYLLGFRLGLWLTNNLGHIREINFAIVGDIDYLFTAGREGNGVDPAIAGDGDKILTIGGNILEWSRSVNVNILVVAGRDLDGAVEGAGDRNPA